MTLPEARTETPRAVSVTRLVGGIAASLGEAFPGSFWIEGEISNFSGPASRGGHLYFSLKDDRNQVAAVIWGSLAGKLAHQPENGAAVLARVRKVDFYGPSGRLSVHLDRLELRGAGASARRLEANRKRFQAEGLFDLDRKRPLPVLPRTIGIVTARSGAVIHDILRILDARFPARAVLLRPVRVQGEGAAAEIAEALDDLGREGSADVIIVGRGGGSAEDLMAFSEEPVVRAIARARVPVISAVGHESDSALSDFVADRRAETPTAAAAMVVPIVVQERARLAELGQRLERSLQSQVRTRRLALEGARRELRRVTSLAVRAREQLDDLAGRAMRSLVRLTPARRERLDALAHQLGRSLPAPGPLRAGLFSHAERLERAMALQVDVARRQLEGGERALGALSPLGVLDRGFSLVRREDGAIVRDAAEVLPGDAIDLRFARGSATARVLESEPEEDAE